MSLIELIFIAISLSMDAFAIAICKGLSLPKLRGRDALKVGLYFGISQGVMPLIGYLLGTAFADLVSSIDHWIAFVLLGFIGGKMILEALDKTEACDCNECSPALDFRSMFPLAIATSIDALAVGISFAFLRVNILSAATLICVVTLLLSCVGVYVGHFFGAKFKSKAELIGGAVLVLMGLKILLEHLNLLPF